MHDYFGCATQKVKALASPADGGEKFVARASRPLWRERPAPAAAKVSLYAWKERPIEGQDEAQERTGRMPVPQRARRPRYLSPSVFLP
jgi:hypothetical protein